jgi:cobalt-zinc-cadmium efflux system protein
VHVELEPTADGERVRLAVAKRLNDEFDLHHVTVQTELDSCEDREHLHP